MATLSEEVDMLRKIPLFAGIDPGKLKLLAFASDRKTYKSGQDLFKQGDPGDAAYVIVDGSADVIIDTDAGEVVVAEVGSNEFIGEISILCEVPRTATVRSSSDNLETLKIKKEHFVGLITQVPDLGVEVMRELASRLSKTTAELGEARRELSNAKTC
ncbi:MAG: cyclic nucleotide-binding domain-containing protein [Pseudomonadota bacterium]